MKFLSSFVYAFVHFLGERVCSLSHQVLKGNCGAVFYFLGILQESQKIRNAKSGQKAGSAIIRLDLQQKIHEMQRQIEWKDVHSPGSFLLGGSILDAFGTLGRPQKFWCLIVKQK